MPLTASATLKNIGAADLLRLVESSNPDGVTVRSAPPALRRVWGRGTGAMTLGNRIYVRPDILEGKGDRLARLLLHELVHVRQWSEKGVIGFLASYIREYLVARATGSSHRAAYLAITAEVEARSIAHQPI